jgi:tripartite-type tricarboxylate transporter receptor subunit TctC
MVSAIRLTHVPYKGTGQSIADTIAGHNQLMLAAVASAIPQIKSARLRAIAVTSARRNPALPGVPTVMEAGYQYEVSNWHGLVGPKGMSRAIVEKLNSEINEVIKDPEFAQRIANDGLVPSGGPPERLLKLITDEMANWARVAEQAGLKAR